MILAPMLPRREAPPDPPLPTGAWFGYLIIAMAAVSGITLVAFLLEVCT